MNFSRIVGTGSYLPERILTNVELEKMVDTDDQWIYDRTGIRERRIAADDETTVDLAYQAANNALAAAGIAANDLDLIIVATTTPDRVFPSTACLLQRRLDVHGCAAFDIQAVCTGFIYALATADQFIKNGVYQNVLVVGAEVMSRIVDWTDRGTCILFGDGAGAVVLSRSEQPGILSSHLHADGKYEDLLTVPFGVGQHYDKLQKNQAYIRMQGNEVFKMAVNSLSQIVDEALEANQMGKQDVDWLIPHQANIRIITATARKLKMSMDHVVVTVDKHGNTSAASVPLALDCAVRDGRIKQGQHLLLEAFGGGFTWGSVLIKW